MERKSFVPEEITTSEQLFEFIHRLNFDKLEIEGINISFSLEFNENSPHEIIAIEDIIDTEAKADFD